MSDESCLLDELTLPNHREFVIQAYRVVLDRLPTASEQQQMLDALAHGDAKTWLLGTLRYGAEGRARGIAIAGLKIRYAAQRAFRMPGVGWLFEWMNSARRLAHTQRLIRAVEQAGAAIRIHDLEASITAYGQMGLRIDRLQNEATGLKRDHEANAQVTREVRAALDSVDVRIDNLQNGIHGLKRDHEASARAAQDVRTALESINVQIDAVQSRLDAIYPPHLADTLEIPGSPLVELARTRAGVRSETPISSLSSHARYAMFETVFYESAAVAAKQRVYIPYIDRELSRRYPFLDLGCGRGEFLRILHAEGVDPVGVDVNPTGLVGLRSDGFNVVEQDLLDFLQADRRMYCGGSLLQVAEHLTHDQIERMLTLVASRLVPGAVLIVETPNPLSAFALAVFHTDPTHVTPLPPERMRYSIEAAGFSDTRTLFQARIPRDQFLGPDPRAYYADYAIIAWRSAP